VTSRCWAQPLGQCDSISGEHVVSNSIFAAGCGCPLVVEGVQRIRNGAPTHGVAKANILCRKHNSALSPLDEVAGKLSAFLHAANDAALATNLMLEGELLERWLLKTVVNATVSGWSGKKKWLPDAGVVAIIFGAAPVPAGCGLYSVDGILRPPSMSGAGVSVQTIVERPPPLEGALLGAYVAIHGMPLFAAFNSSVIPRLESGVDGPIYRKFSPEGLRHLHHPGAIGVSRAVGPSVYIGLSWEGRFRTGPADER
jgi:hypothetical protein